MSPTASRENLSRIPPSTVKKASIGREGGVPPVSIII